MKKVVIHYCEFFAPGSFMANTWTVSHEEDVSVVWPDNAYAYQMWKREDVHDGGKTYKGAPERVGKLIYHPDSKITTIEQVKAGASPPAGSVLIQNMEGNKWEAVVWSRWGNWPQPWEPERMEIAA